MIKVIQNFFLIAFYALIFGLAMPGCQQKYDADPGAIKALADAGFIEGEHFHVLPKPLYTEQELNNRVRVIEFFWYGCSHCYLVEKPLQRWLKKKPSQIEFEKYPAMWNSAMELHAQMYFVAKKIGAPDLLNSLFPTILAMREVKDIQDQIYGLQRHFEKFYIDAEEFNKLAQSEEIEDLVDKANKLQREAKVTGTPAFVIDGIYRIENKSVEHLSKIFTVIDRFSKTLLRYKLQQQVEKNSSAEE